MTNFKISKLRLGLHDLSESIADDIILFCLAHMGRGPSYHNWKIGISTQEKQGVPEQSKSFKCDSNLQALDTKRYFVEEKLMQDGGEEEGGLFLWIEKIN